MRAVISFKGTAPLLLHNVRLADPLNEWAKELKALSSKRAKTEEDHMAMARVEFLGGLYIRDDGPYLPSTMLHRVIQDGAKLSKNGKNIERGLIVLDDASLVYKGPRKAEAMFKDKSFVDRRVVSVGQQKVVRTRPCFHDWAVEFEVEVIEDLLDLDILKRVIDDAGRCTGVGDYRPRFGRFQAKVEVLK
jgi:hypothetical protein